MNWLNEAPKEQTWLDAPEWMDRAACAGMPWGFFFAEDFERPAKAAKRAEDHLIGLGVCVNCPVREDCLEEAISDPNLDYGIRGGLTSQQRRAIRRRRNR